MVEFLYPHTVRSFGRQARVCLRRKFQLQRSLHTTPLIGTALLRVLLLQVYTFALQPLFQGDASVQAAALTICKQLLQQQSAEQQQEQGQDNPVVGFELQLIMEFMEEVRDRPGSRLNDRKRKGGVIPSCVQRRQNH